MRLHKTGHQIADTVSDRIGELPNGNYSIAYGILRHNVFDREHWFEIDKGLWGNGHYDGLYRISYKATQPIYDPKFPNWEQSEIPFRPWRKGGEYTLICPPTNAVCQFFGISYSDWLIAALRKCHEPNSYRIRHKGDENPIDWPKVKRVITFNSSVGIQALIRGIPVISDEKSSSIGSYCANIGSIDNFDRMELFSFIQNHSFKLNEKDKICRVIAHYLSS